MISQALIDSEISHKNYNIIINEEYRRLKENIRITKGKKNDAEED